MARSSNTSANLHTITSEGQFAGGSYKITRNVSSTFLSVKLEPNGELIMYTSPNNIVAKDNSIQIEDNADSSLQNIFLFEQPKQFSITGIGDIILAPPVYGDILPIQLNGNTKWTVREDGFFAKSGDVNYEPHNKNTLALMLSAKTYFFEISGNGIAFVNSIGTIIQRQLKNGEQWSVSEGHLIAYNCRLVEKIHELSQGTYILEGPGVFFAQSQNAQILARWIKKFQ